MLERLMQQALKFPMMPPEETHNTAFFYERLHAALGKIALFDTAVWGTIGGFDFYHCRPRKIDPARKNILISGGFHGEEPAGSWAIVHFLETATPKELNAANIFLLPLGNPTGFDKNRRHNDWDQDPNQGYDGKPPGPSKEGELLLAHLDEIVTAAAGGFLSLHEDSDMTQGYLWSQENAARPGALTIGVLQVIDRHFGLFRGKMPHRGHEIDMPLGFGFNVMDNSFEGLLGRHGVPFCATPETPAHPDVPIDRRVACHREVIGKFIELTCGA